MKRALLTLFAVSLLAAGCNHTSTPTPSQNPTLKQNSSSKDIGASELLGFLDSKFDCSTPKDPQSSNKKCFDSNLDPLSSQSLYDKPVYLLEDLTGDGAKDALLTVYYNGSGAERDFYAFTKDTTVQGDTVTSDMKLVYQNQGVGFSRYSPPWTDGKGGYIVTCPDRDKDGEPDCQMNLQWGGTPEQKYFEEKPITSKTGMQTYTSQTYGYTFTYADKTGLVIHRSNIDLHGTGVLESVDIHDPISNPIEAFGVGVYSNPKTLSAASFIKQHPQLWASNYIDLQTKQTTFVKLPAILVTGAHGISTDMVIASRNYIFLIKGDFSAFKTFRFLQ